MDGMMMMHTDPVANAYVCHNQSEYLRLGTLYILRT